MTSCFRAVRGLDHAAQDYSRRSTAGSREFTPVPHALSDGRVSQGEVAMASWPNCITSNRTIVPVKNGLRHIRTERADS